MSKKFDLVFEKLLGRLLEKEYVDSTFEDNVQLLIKTLIDNDFLQRGKDVDALTKQTMAQPNNVKEIRLDTQEKSLPAMKVKVAQESDSESFSVTVINLKDPAKPKTFENSMLETIFDDVVAYIKTVALQGAQPEAAVDQLPPEEGANAQPGGETSALPQGEQAAAQQPPA